MRYTARTWLHWPATVAFCGVLPVLTLAVLFLTAVEDDATGLDFRAFYGAAQSVLRGETPYVSLDSPSEPVSESYVYPPLTALLVSPLTWLSEDAAALLAMVVVICAALAIPYVLGVRDWRCYGLLLLWPPVITGIQTANMSIILALMVAVAWRVRDRAAWSGLCVGLALATKLMIWPLVVWLAATRRTASALVASIAGVALVFGPWAVIGFQGLTSYPELLQRLQDAIELDCYTVYVLALDLGASPTLARAVWMVSGLSVLAAAVVLARRPGRQRASFVLALAALLLLSPIVWLHYFTLLLPVVALAQPTLGAAWFVPLAMVLATAQGNPTFFQTAVTMGAAALTVGLAVRALQRKTSAETHVGHSSQALTGPGLQDWLAAARR